MKKPATIEPADVAHRLKAMRTMAHLSIDSMASRLGLPTSTYRHYEDRYKNAYLPLDFVRSVMNALEGTDVPPEAILELAGPLPQIGNPSAISGFGEPEPSRPMTETARRLATVPPVGAVAAAVEEEIRIAMNGRFVQVAATVDREGLAKLMRKLEKIEGALDD